MDNLTPLTHAHLKASKLMPRKRHPLWLGEKKDKAYSRQAKKDRKAIADYYRFYRSDYDHGPAAASRAHRYAVVTTGQDARYRLKQLA